MARMQVEGMKEKMLKAVVDIGLGMILESFSTLVSEKWGGGVF